MKTPMIRSDVTKEWVEFMLNEYENRENPGSKVTLKSWDLGSATKTGDNYSGDIAKLEAKGTLHCKGTEEHEKEYHHILKFRAPEAFNQEFVRKMGMGQNEMIIYANVIEEFNKFQAELSGNQFPINIPTYIYHRDNKNEQVLVMENMKVHGYVNREKEEGLGFEDAKSALEQLARLHGISYAYNKKNDFLKKYPCYDGTQYSSMNTMCLDVVIDNVIKFLGTQSDQKDLLEKVTQAKPHTLKKMTEAFDKRSNQIRCLNHGDPWTNNVLIKENSDDGHGKIVLIDWEAAHWNTSAYDLTYFMGGSLVPDTRKRQDELLQHYHSHFTNVTTTLGFPVPEFGFEQCKEEFLAVSAWALTKNLTFAMLLSEASKKWKMSEHSSKPGAFKKGMAKMMVPLMMKPSMMNMMFKGMWKGFLSPVMKEMKTKKNEPLNKRFLECILEADRNGIFNIPPTAS